MTSIYEIPKKEFVTFKKKVMKKIDSDIQKSPSQFIQTLGILYVKEKLIDCNVLNVVLNDGSHYYIPIKK